MFRILFVLLLLSCSGVVGAVERQDAELTLAQASTAVQNARRDDAPTYAVAEFATAQTSLNAAMDACNGRAWTQCLIYSERARVDGDLAAARGRQVRAESAADELERSLDSLRAQIAAGGGS